ncbi:hypothetical protein OH492_07485 [Vibrio chagasii]|nr:hypothetical protein [Vibrio chagasii]
MTWSCVFENVAQHLSGEVKLTMTALASTWLGESFDWAERLITPGFEVHKAGKNEGIYRF